MSHHTTESAASVARTAAEAYTPRQRHVVLLFAVVGALIESMELNLLSFPLQDIRTSFGVSATSVVEVITIQSIASIVGGFLFGWIADRFGRRPTYVAFTTTYGVLAVVGAFVTHFGLFTLTRGLAGVAMGGAFGVIFAMFSETWRSTRRGFMGSVLQGMFIAGTLVTQLVLYLTLSAFGSDTGWRTGFVVIGALCLLVSVAAVKWLPESRLWQASRRVDPAAATVVVESADGRGTALSGRRLGWGAAFLTITTTGVFASSYAYITFAPTWLREDAGLDLGPATLVMTIGTLAGIGSYLVFGTFSDRVGRRWATFASCLVGVAGFALFLLAGRHGVADGSSMSSVVSVAVAGLLGCAVGYGGFGVLGTWISEFYPTRYRAFGSGATYYVARGIGSGLFPLWALGWAGGDLRVALAFGGVGAALGLLTCLLVPDTRGRVITAQG